MNWRDDNGTRECPFCGEKEEFEEFIWPDVEIVWKGESSVRCMACGALGPPCPTWPQAQIAWNQRGEDDGSEDA